MARARHDPSSVFRDPISIVEITDLPYDLRLRLLQRWASQIKDDPEAHLTHERIIGATMALQSGAKLKIDRPEGSLDEHGYGVVESTDLRHPDTDDDDREELSPAKKAECKTRR